MGRTTYTQHREQHMNRLTKILGEAICNLIGGILGLFIVFLSVISGLMLFVWTMKAAYLVLCILIATLAHIVG